MSAYERILAVCVIPVFIGLVVGLAIYDIGDLHSKELREVQKRWKAVSYTLLCIGVVCLVPYIFEGAYWIREGIRLFWNWFLDGK